MSNDGLGPKPSFLGSRDYQNIWTEQARGNRRPGRQGEAPDELLAMPYWQYLRTAHWQEVRTRALAAAEHRCFYCGATNHLDVHHQSYARRGCELDEDLIVLCRTCHVAEHETQDELDDARQRAELARRKPTSVPDA